ncbi:MAG: zinc-dependent alcohol dehydrogenase family protein [Pseudomonadota bacterium]
MQQAFYNKHGHAPDVIDIRTVDPQPLGEGQTRVKILRSPINPSDIAQIGGVYGLQPPLPAPAGMEGIGEVIEVNGEGHPVGTLVLLSDPPGAWVTERVFPSAALVPVPHADIDQLSMLTVNPATAYLLLTQYVDLKEGGWIIQSAGNSAVGRYITQLAKARGIKVASVVRRESAIADVEDAGCDAAFVDGPDLAERVAAKLDAAPVLAIDAVSGPVFGRLAATLADGGTAVSYGGMSGEDMSIPDNLIIFNNVVVRGFWLVNWLTSAGPEEMQRVYGELTQLVLEGKLNAPIDKIFTLDQINEALAYTVAGGRSGKVLLAPNGV